MYDADIESLILSGEFFNGPARSSSPTRSASPDSGWHNDELEEDADYDSDTARRSAFEKQLSEQQSQHESIGMGPGRTGVKGVIRDRNEANDLIRAKRTREIDEINRKMAQASLGGKTFLEEERDKAYRGEKADDLVVRELEKNASTTDTYGRTRLGRFGHLREVGVKGFLDAVEKVDRGVWVVVHLYEPSLERCYHLDETLSRLARTYPDTKFIRSRASGLGFASSAATSSSSTVSATRPPRNVPGSYDDDDPYAGIDDDDNDDLEDDDDDGAEVDTDMLPTMLVYRDGDLVHNWVRVDWEAGDAGVEELLDKYHILPRAESLLGSNLGLPSDDDDDRDLIWSDEEDL